MTAFATVERTGLALASFMDKLYTHIQPHAKAIGKAAKIDDKYIINFGEEVNLPPVAMNPPPVALNPPYAALNPPYAALSPPPVALNPPSMCVNLQAVRGHPLFILSTALNFLAPKLRP
jgi:hypothetical protein